MWTLWVTSLTHAVSPGPRLPSYWRSRGGLRQLLVDPDLGRERMLGLDLGPERGRVRDPLRRSASSASRAKLQRGGDYEHLTPRHRVCAGSSAFRAPYPVRSRFPSTLRHIRVSSPGTRGPPTQDPLQILPLLITYSFFLQACIFSLLLPGAHTDSPSDIFNLGFPTPRQPTPSPSGAKSNFTSKSGPPGYPSLPTYRGQIT